jgi:hypothetical protein
MLNWIRATLDAWLTPRLKCRQCGQFEDRHDPRFFRDCVPK